jgi:hypothetical protein
VAAVDKVVAAGKAVAAGYRVEAGVMVNGAFLERLPGRVRAARLVRPHRGPIPVVRRDPVRRASTAPRVPASAHLDRTHTEGRGRTDPGIAAASSLAAATVVVDL